MQVVQIANSQEISKQKESMLKRSNLEEICYLLLFEPEPESTGMVTSLCLCIDKLL